MTTASTPSACTASAAQGVTIGGIEQLGHQAVAVAVTIVYSAVVTFIILKVVDLIMGLRVTAEEEREGLDIVLHGEQLF